MPVTLVALTYTEKVDIVPGFKLGKDLDVKNLMVLNPLHGLKIYTASKCRSCS